MKRLVISEIFSATPGGRYYTDGPHSGEEFREEYLIPALEEDEDLLLVLDGARGYPSSFLDEAFAGLMREHQWTKDRLLSRIRFEASPAFKIYVDDILQYIDDQDARS